MMSKERELLRRISSHSEARIPTHFIYELQELLAQPEQEAVATKLEAPQFQSFRVSFEDAKKLEELPTGTKIYTSPPITQREEYQRGYAPKLAQQEPLPPKNLLIEKCDTFLRSLIENNGEGLKELKAFDLETYNKLKEVFGNE